MSETHINAYFADVEEKKKAFNQAQAELMAAKDRLEAKKLDVGWKEDEESESDEDEDDADEKGKKAPDSASGFGIRHKR